MVVISRFHCLYNCGSYLCCLLDHLGGLTSASDSVSIHMLGRETKIASTRSNSSLIKPSIVQNLENTIDLLLSCSADVNKAISPLPAIFYVVLAGDIHMTCRLMLAGADLNMRLDTQQGGSGLLHLLATQQDTLRAVELMRLLLEGGADPNKLEINKGLYPFLCVLLLCYLITGTMTDTFHYNQNYDYPYPLKL